MLQISKNGKRKYQSLGVSISLIYWDFAKSKPKPNFPNGKLIQKVQLDKVTEIQKQILEFSANQQEFTPTKLLERKKAPIKENAVGEFYTELLLFYKQTDKTGNRLVYKMSYNSIKEFFNKLTKNFCHFLIPFLNRNQNLMKNFLCSIILKLNKNVIILYYYTSIIVT